MTSIPRTLLMGALALAAGLAAVQTARAQLGRAATTTPSAATETAPSASVTSLLRLSSVPVGNSPAAPTAGVDTQPLGRIPVSQPIPAPLSFD